MYLFYYSIAIPGGDFRKSSVSQNNNNNNDDKK